MVIFHDDDKLMDLSTSIKSFKEYVKIEGVSLKSLLSKE